MTCMMFLTSFGARLSNQKCPMTTPLGRRPDGGPSVPSEESTEAISHKNDTLVISPLTRDAAIHQPAATSCTSSQGKYSAVQRDTEFVMRANEVMAQPFSVTLVPAGVVRRHLRGGDRSRWVFVS
jgi:hypothetical protein